MTSGWLRVSRNTLCPVCSHPDWCLIAKDGKAAICARVESDKPAGNKGAGWLHILDNTKQFPLLPKQKSDIKQTPKAAPDILDISYKALLAELELSETHRLTLQRRGLTDSEIHALGYKSIPANGRQELITRLQTRDIKLAGVPGFYLKAGQWNLSGESGITIPVRDIKGRIIGLQIRCDKADGGKYKWVSSKGFNGGCSPGAPVHVAGKVAKGAELWITEGPLKADILALKMGCTVLAVPGVGNWHSVMPIMHEAAPARAIIAFDMDKLSNPTVNYHKNALMTSLIRQGIRTFEADWDAQFKGLDDLLTGG